MYSVHYLFIKTPLSLLTSDATLARTCHTPSSGGFFFFFLTLKIFSKQDWPVDGLSLTYSPSCKVQAQLSLICQRGLTCISSSLHLPHLFCNAPSHNQAVHTKLFCTSSKGRPIFIFILLFFFFQSRLSLFTLFMTKLYFYFTCDWRVPLYIRRCVFVQSLTSPCS